MGACGEGGDVFIDWVMQADGRELPPRGGAAAERLCSISGRAGQP